MRNEVMYHLHPLRISVDFAKDKGRKNVRQQRRRTIQYVSHVRFEEKSSKYASCKVRCYHAHFVEGGENPGCDITSRKVVLECQRATPCCENHDYYTNGD